MGPGWQQIEPYLDAKGKGYLQDTPGIKQKAGLQLCSKSTQAELSLALMSGRHTLPSLLTCTAKNGKLAKSFCLKDEFLPGDRC